MSTHSNTGRSRAKTLVITYRGRGGKPVSLCRIHRKGRKGSDILSSLAGYEPRVIRGEHRTRPSRTSCFECKRLRKKSKGNTGRNGPQMPPSS